MRVIAGKAKGKKLLPPEGMGTRPTLDRIKESIFNIIQNRVRDAVSIDIFSGTGSLGIEAASRGAKHSYLIEKGDSSYNLLKKNVENLKFQDICTTLKGDCYQYLEGFGKEKKVFDLIFIDPPYAKEMIPPAIELISKYHLLQREGLIITKIDSSEIIYEGNDKIILIDKRKYGNTTVCFYEYKEI
ncbi:RNA methyltransferase, RsmD family [Clostridium argentinense CDC 2741]|uniref:RNA methyltransferase, RsmD family n=1 Tax=Clostridium argentinense CDC 2741 TaxID=1418104 RepID=A0A0C1R1M9_9CLOT|nr:16S rRNA (guanine(966)-N(2))-methyltransferase RsmD [Clostridium argentinense]ARC85697.1 16S rRNA (guanine(966)-N(2))-methyltransferase RsmD [Clostridium argentinense]KIE47337.1 RNA methyltransferase, RsmD family [Clostridium argentinense CDC 2741]NFF40779.1 16S rRNA (guanine(966)-N(2))-methyltransferase RsmD [Clostridium argentinense]NFP50711.1 16S rRNA (guanine(966)-N(2))-methyltransferase RsmD [Clostridium argentinense]NFP73132.1 16S rRNA (guanine(966)-N(2))-methyltransferase RsmD [Clost